MSMNLKTIPIMAELAMAGASDEIVRKVFWGNAARLYGMTAPV